METICATKFPIKLKLLINGLATESLTKTNGNTFVVTTVPLQSDQLNPWS